MKKALIIFTRAPIPGQTKTRLHPIFTPEECAALHTAFLKDLQHITKQQEWHSFICFTPEHEKALLTPLFQESADYFTQSGQDLGTRMSNAMEHIFQMGFNKCLLVGTDIPSLSFEIVKEAFGLLEAADLVLGPTEDMGYYLIGMKKLYPGLFSDQSYGDGNVIGNMISAARRNGLTYQLTKTLRDIDIPDDIIWYASALAKQPDILKTHTASFVKYLKGKYKL